MEERSSVARATEPVIVEMVYVGIHTATYMWSAQHGTRTLATTKRDKRLHAKYPGDVLLSLHEAINILERQQGVPKTPEELTTEIQDYQQGIQHIEREPDAYVAPDVARTWYEQQIQRIREALTKEAS